jgi:hypothetical protein
MPGMLAGSDKDLYDKSMKWVAVHRANTVTEAEAVSNMLGSFGIPATVSGESIRTPFGQGVDGMGVAVVRVPEDRAQEAREILADEPDSDA